MPDWRDQTWWIGERALAGPEWEGSRLQGQIGTVISEGREYMTAFLTVEFEDGTQIEAPRGDWILESEVQGGFDG